jgi:hypothetical protein
MTGLTLQPGLNTIAFSKDAPGVAESQHPDARARTLALYDLKVLPGGQWGQESNGRRSPHSKTDASRPII